MSYNFPISPAENQEFTPPGGVTYVWKTPRWLVSGLPPDSGGGGAATSIDIAPPASPVAGQLWWDSDSDSGRLYIFYDDGNTQQWVEVVPPVGASKDYVDGNFLPLSGGTLSGPLTVKNQLSLQRPAVGTTLWQNWNNELGYAEYSWRLGSGGELYLRRYDGLASGLYTNVFTITPLTGTTAKIGINGEFNLVQGNITFPAAQVASADPNALDDYEEGVFTPTIYGSSTAGVGTYSLQAGQYTKIGNRVQFEIRLTWSAHTGTGNMRINGLPFTIGPNAEPVTSLNMSNITFTGIVTAIGGASSANLYFYSNVTNAAAAGLAIDTAGAVNITGSYQVV